MPSELLQLSSCHTSNSLQCSLNCPYLHGSVQSKKLSCLFSLTVHLFDLNSKGPSEVIGLHRWQIDLFWHHLISRQNWVHCVKTIVAFDETPCIARTFVGFLLKGSGFVCFNDFQLYIRRRVHVSRMVARLSFSVEQLLLFNFFSDP